MWRPHGSQWQRLSEVGVHVWHLVRQTRFLDALAVRGSRRSPAGTRRFRLLQIGNARTSYCVTLLYE
jgi:hypothetical protein